MKKIIFFVLISVSLFGQRTKMKYLEATNTLKINGKVATGIYVTGATIDTTKLTGSSNGIILGNCTIIDSATTYYSGIVTYSSTTAVEIDVFAISAFAGTVYTRFTTVTKDIPFSFGNTDVVSIYFECPIVEYA